MSDRPVAVVTGGGRGLGRGITLALARAGHDLVVGYATARDEVAATADAARATGAEVVTVAGDVADPVTSKELAATATGTLGGLDVWVNNAGISLLAPLLDTSPADLARLWEVNVAGTLQGLQAAAGAMRGAGIGGRIVNVASDAGLQGFPLLGAYAATKFAVVGLTQVAALELAPDGIAVNAVCPGTAETAMNRAEWAAQSALTGEAESGVRAGYLADIPLGRLTTPEDVGAVVTWLVGDSAAFVTGQSVCVNGGTVLH